MIRIDRIELVTYPSRPLDPMDFKAKETSYSSSVETKPNHKNLKKMP